MAGPGIMFPVNRSAWFGCCILGAAWFLAPGCGYGPAAHGQDATEQTGKIESMYRGYEREFPQVPDVLPSELLAATNKTALLVDVRSPAEQAVSMIPGAVTRRDFERDVHQYKGRPVVTYCTIGYRSGLYAETLRKKGWDVRNLRGSILGWVHAGGKVVNKEGKTRTVHVYGPAWSLLPDGYKAVMFSGRDAPGDEAAARGAGGDP